MWRKNSYSYYKWLTIIQKIKNLRPRLVHWMEIMLGIEIYITRNIRRWNIITIYIYIFGLKFDRNYVQVNLKENFYKIILYNKFFP